MSCEKGPQDTVVGGCDIVKGCEINLKKILNMLLRLSAEYDRAGKVYVFRKIYGTMM